MKLYYDQPARNWHESLPMGNGRLGATVYGGTKKETLALNEDTLWSGYPEKTQKELPEGYLTKVRELTEKREYQKALDYLQDCFKTSEDVQMYIPFGNLCMEMLGEEEISDYHIPCFSGSYGKTGTAFSEPPSPTVKGTLPGQWPLVFKMPASQLVSLG